MPAPERFTLVVLAPIKYVPFPALIEVDSSSSDGVVLKLASDGAEGNVIGVIHEGYVGCRLPL